MKHFGYYSVLALGLSGNIIADDLDLIPDSMLDEDAFPDSTVASTSNSNLDITLRTQTQLARTRLDTKNQQSTYTSIDLRGEFGDKVNTLKLNSALHASTAQNKDFDIDDDVQLDIKELYYSRKLSRSAFLDIGRINIPNGVAFGFNPTDFYKATSLIDSRDTSARERRNNRLGPVAIRYEKSFKGSNLSLTIAPKIKVSDSSLLSDKDIFGQRFNESNSSEQASISYTHNSDQGSSKQLSLFYKDGLTSLGFNTSFVISSQFLAYGEWRVQNSRSLAADYIHQLNAQGIDLDDSIQQRLQENKKQLHKQLVTGLSWSTQHNITTRFELHYSGLAMTDDDWEHCFALLENQGNTAELWSLRGVFFQQSELASTKAIWLRSEWTDAMPDFSPGLMFNHNPDDGGTMIQAFFKYSPSDSVVLDLNLSTFSGDKNSLMGSLANKQTLTAQLNWYF